MDTYLLKAADIEAMPGLKKTHFLNDNAVRLNKSLGDATGLTGLGFHLIEVEPGHDTTEYHRHFFEDECVYIISGTGRARIGDETYEVSPGDFIGYRKGGLPHDLKATGPEPLRCLVAGERNPHDVGEYPEKGKRIYRNEDLGWDLVDQDKLEKVTGGTGQK